MISDSVCMDRNQKGLSQIEIKNNIQIFLLLNDLGKKYPNVIVIGITNRPWALDPAALRRFGRKIYVPKPGFQDRKSILRLQVTMADGTNNVTEKELDKMAALSKGLSASDISE